MLDVTASALRQPGPCCQLDVILSDVGGVIWKASWSAESDAPRFKHTADGESVQGDEARHGRERTEPPADPMSLTDADVLIRNIMRGWLASKSATRS